MGDVALVLPVIRSLVHAYPNAEVTIVTRPKFAPFFYDIERVHVFPADVDHTYNGFFGLRDLFKALMRKSSYDVVVDLHDHVRTMILRTFFRFFFTPVVVFDKGRPQKKAFARKKKKIPIPLPHTVKRYQAAFAKAGFPFDLLPPPHFHLKPELHSVASEWLKSKGLIKNELWIGIAPFALHRTKIWPISNYEVVINKVLERTNAKFFLFGGGEKEIRFFEELRAKFPHNCIVTAGQLKIRQEIALMTHLDTMLCVDSSNMHLAALAGVRVVSIWGGTHPDVGFAPFTNQAKIIQISTDELPCRPCSVYGRETCYVGGFPCQTRISPEIVVEQLLEKK